MTIEQIEEKLNSIGQELAISERTAIQKSNDFEVRIKALETQIGTIIILNKRADAIEARFLELTNVINHYVAVIKTIQTSIQQLNASKADIPKVATPQVPPQPSIRKGWWNF